MEVAEEPPTVDVPWRPAHLEQREGRIIRQGNQNPEVKICNYVTEGTFDTVMWQTVERKARFIAQLKTGDVDARTADDIGSDDLGDAAAATKAVATGDPRYLDQVRLDDEVKRLTALEQSHRDGKSRHRVEVRQADTEVAATAAQLDEIDAAMPGIAATVDAPFAITVGGQRYTERAPAATALLHAAGDAYEHGRHYGASRSFPIAELRGVEVRASRWVTSDELAISLSIPSRINSVPASTVRGDEGLGLLRRVENLVSSVPERRSSLEHRRDRALQRIDELVAVADAPFEHREQLAEKTAALQHLTAQLRAKSDSPEAVAAKAEAAERMDALGRRPGWSLVLNPTPAMLEEMGVDPAQFRAQQAASRAASSRSGPPATRTLTPTAEALARRRPHTATAAQRPTQHPPVGQRPEQRRPHI